MALEIKAENQILVDRLTASIKKASKFHTQKDQSSQEFDQSEQKEAA